MRLYVIDNSIIDVFLSPSGRYSYHWERRHIDGTIYRHDNAPHNEWSDFDTFPKHFHDGTNNHVDAKNSYISNDPVEAAHDFLTFVEKKFSEGK
ncbi:hypothetical protein KGY79_13270 [Candidatus Bipolaricaulota bacterium]|nr:hypothetical protein [Candidatus Bipolaricaulota bacterium]